MPAYQFKAYALVFALLTGLGLFTRCAKADTTLSVGTATFSVKHTNNSISASDQSIYVGDTVTETFPASLKTSGTNAAGKECTVDSANWSWSIVSVTYSRDGSTFNADSYRPSIGGGSTGVMTATFPNDVNHPPGFWKITAHVHVDIVSSTCPNNPLDQIVGPYGFSVARGDFGLTAAPNSLTILLGGSGVETVTVTPLAGFDGVVNLSLLGAPTGVTGDAFSVSPVYPNSIQRGFNIYVAETTVPGTYPALVPGTTGVYGHSAPLTIKVPKRYVEIDGPWGPPAAPNYQKSGGSTTPVPNTRNLSDGSIKVDTLISAGGIDPQTLNRVWYCQPTLTANTTSPDGATGFLQDKTYTWHYGGALTNKTINTFEVPLSSSQISPNLITESYQPYNCNIITVTYPLM